MEVTLTVDAPGYMAQAVKESIGMAAEQYGAARVVSVRELPSGPGVGGQCQMESMARLPWDGAPRTKKG